MAVISTEIVPCAPSSLAGVAAQPLPLILAQGLLLWLLCFNKGLKEIISPRKTGAGFYWMAALWLWVLHVTLKLNQDLRGYLQLQWEHTHTGQVK